MSAELDELRRAGNSAEAPGDEWLKRRARLRMADEEGAFGKSGAVPRCVAATRSDLREMWPVRDVENAFIRPMRDRASPAF